MRQYKLVNWTQTGQGRKVQRFQIAAKNRTEASIRAKHILAEVGKGELVKLYLLTKDGEHIVWGQQHAVVRI